MIMRIWKGVTLERDAEAYFAYMMKTGVRMYRSTRGNLGVQVLRRIRDGKAEFMLFSLWDSAEAIRGFAGPDIERAYYGFPEDDKYLLEKEPLVDHFEVLAAEPSAPPKTPSAAPYRIRVIGFE